MVPMTDHADAVDSPRPARSRQRPSDLHPQSRIYGWMERARIEGVHFPLGVYNARIPQDLFDESLRRAATDFELPTLWSEHFRPATEDEVLALLSKR